MSNDNQKTPPKKKIIGNIDKNKNRSHFIKDSPKSETSITLTIPTPKVKGENGNDNSNKE